MKLNERIAVMAETGKYLQSAGEELLAVKRQAFQKNPWFTIDFINTALNNISEQFLDADKLTEWANYYHLDDNITPKNVGIVMAGNIPIVGFHDFLAAFISGHRQTIKLSAKDDVLLRHLIEILYVKYPSLREEILLAERLKDCDAYIATGSNNTSRYFEYYFGKYPHIIRHNRTSVAVLTGNESKEELELLADDVHLYFGLGCRNVTMLYIPENYDFKPLLEGFKKYNIFLDHTKYRNNYDYNLAALIMNGAYYMTNGSILLTESEDIFSPIARLNYHYYKDKENLVGSLRENKNIQSTVGKGELEFGKTQQPSLFTYADGVDTMQFLLSL